MAKRQHDNRAKRGDCRYRIEQRLDDIILALGMRKHGEACNGKSNTYRKEQNGAKHSLRHSRLFYPRMFRIFPRHWPYAPTDYTMIPATVTTESPCEMERVVRKRMSAIVIVSRGNHTFVGSLIVQSDREG